MAITSIWSVKGWLGKVIVYTENPDKTENPAYFEKADMTEVQVQGLSDVIDYASEIRKTALSDENAKILRHLVTGINCAADTARDEMMAAKRKFGKADGVVAYHGIQSFSPDDVTSGLNPDMAHEIAVKLASELWGDTHQVVVATHLDKANHLHSHFVVNTVSWIDGRRYHRTEMDYYRMQAASDKLCLEYGLSVIEDPKRGKSKHYGEWRAEKCGAPTYRGLVKAELDRAIGASMTERALWDSLYRRGWRIKFGADITVKPPGKERGLKLKRNFGEDYSIESIRKRILSNTRPSRLVIPADRPPPKSMANKRNVIRKSTGLRALYFYYLYKMGVLPKRRRQNPNTVHFLFREDIRHIRNISKETRLLVRCGIDTYAELTAHKEGLAKQIKTLADTRKHLRYKARGIEDEKASAAVKSEIAAVSARIGELRREVRLCEDIEVRSAVMTDKLGKAEEEQKKQPRKEVKEHDTVRRGG